MTREERRISRLRELLVRHGNRVEMLTRCALTPKEKTFFERERRAIWKRLMTADSRLLKIAADELNERELRWALGRER